MTLTLIPEKNYKKCFAFFVTLTLTIPKPSTAKVLIDNSLSHLIKPIPLFIPMLSSILEPPRLSKKFIFP